MTIDLSKVTDKTLIGYKYDMVKSSHLPIFQFEYNRFVFYQIGQGKRSYIMQKRPMINVTIDEYECLHQESIGHRFDTFEKIEQFLDSNQHDNEDDTTMAILRYYGSKWRLAKWIISHFPPQDMYDCYIDGFGGGGAMTINVPNSYVQVYNDLDRAVWTFMKVLREQTDDLVNAIMLTPYSRFELRQCDLPRDPSELAKLSDLEIARRVYVRSWQGRGMTSIAGNTGWRFTKTPRIYPPNDFYDVDDIFIAADRIRHIQLENDDIMTIIKNYDGPKTLFYLDPPYIESAGDRYQKNGGYRHEMNQDWRHRELLERVLHAEGFFIISAYRSALYREVLRYWECKQTEGFDDKGNKKIECLWLSPNISAIQTRMF